MKFDRTTTKDRIISAFLVVLVVLNVFFPTSVLAQTSNFNKQINYQGKLTDSAGSAVSDGSYNIEVKLYTASSGGSAIWTETRTGSNRAAVTNGLFSIMLGAVTSIDSVDFNQTLYLGVNIGGSSATASWDGEMTPRKILGAVPAAFESDKIDGLDSTQLVRSDATNTIATSSTNALLVLNQKGTGDILNINDNGVRVLTVLDGGNVGIGTSSPYAALSVVGQIVGAYFTGTTSATSSFGGPITVAGTNSTSTFAGGIDVGRSLNVTGSATSTFSSGINLSSGCFSINNTCIAVSGSGSPGGSDTQIQFNQGGSFGGDATFTFNYTSKLLTIQNLLATASSTLQNFSFVNATGTSATTTNFFATTASSTNLFSTSLYTGNATSTGALYVGNTLGIGINPNSAVSLLDVNGPIAMAGIQTFDNNGSNLYIKAGGANNFIAFQPSNSVYVGKFLGNGTIALGGTDAQESGSPGLYIGGTSKNVGLGTTTPEWTLQVASATPYIAITDNNASTNNKHWLLSNNNGVFSIGTSSDLFTGTSSRFSIAPNGSTTLTGLSINSVVGTSTSNVGWNITGGCFAINGTCVGGSAGTPGGSDTQVQFNDGGSTFGGDAGLVYNKTTDLLTLVQLLATGSTTLQNFTGLANTTTNATSTNFFATTASSTNLLSTTFYTGNATSTGVFNIDRFITVASTAGTSTLAGALSVGSTTISSRGLFSVGTSSQLLFVDKSTGQMGIGTDDPSAKIDIVADATSNGIEVNGITTGQIIDMSNSALTSGTGIKFAGSTLTSGKFIDMTGIGGASTAFTGAGINVDLERLAFSTITDTGNLLKLNRNIGSSVSSLTNTGDLALFVNAPYSTFVDDSSNVLHLIQYIASSTGATLLAESRAFANVARFVASSTDSSATSTGVFIDSRSTLNTNYALRIRGGNSAEALYVSAMGNSGLGTTTPEWTLQVASATPYIAITDNNASTNNKHWLLSNNNGVFSIGTSSDLFTGTSSRFSIAPNGSTTLTGLSINSVVGTSTSNVGWNITGGCFAINGTCVGSSGGTPAGSANEIQFRSSGSFGADARFVWDDSNNRLGIGTTTPMGTLSIDFDTDASLVIFNNGSTTPAFWVGGLNDNGNVGFGTSTPQEKIVLAGGSFFQSPATTTAKIVRSYGIGSNPTDITLNGSYAYVTDSGSDDFRVIDVTNPLYPTTRGTLSIAASNPEAVVLNGRYAYMVSDFPSVINDQLAAIDISKKNVPVVVGTASLGDITTTDIFRSGQRVFMLETTTDTMKVYNITNAGNLESVTSVSAGTNPKAVHVTGRYAFVVDDTTIRSFEVGTSTSATALANLALTGTPVGLFVAGNYAYVITSTPALRIIDISNPASMVEVGSLSIGASPRDIKVSGRYAYVVANGSDDLRIIDVASSTSPTELDRIGLGTSPEAVAISGRYAYVVDNGTDDLKVVDISGAEFTSVIAHALQTGSLTVRNDITTDGHVNIGGGLAVGPAGVLSDGPISVGVNASGTPIRNTLYADNMVKAWVQVRGGATPAIAGAFNVSSVTDQGAGRFNIVYGTQFVADQSYAITCSSSKLTNGTADNTMVSPQDDTTVLATSTSIAISDDISGLSDPDLWSCIAVGRQ